MGKPRHRRHMRNLLLDRRFQLKYAGYMIAGAALLSALLGYFLWDTSRSLVVQSQKTVAQGQHVVKLGESLAKESRKVSQVVEMNMAKEYADDPELRAIFKGEQGHQDHALDQQQKALEAHAAQLRQQAKDLAGEQRNMFLMLFGLLTLLVIGIGLMGIVVTHKIAGPVFKMTRQLKQLGAGDWRLPSPLRKGDELEHFFGAFRDTVGQLRAQRAKELAALERALQALDEEAGCEETRQALQALCAEMKQTLADEPT